MTTNSRHSWAKHVGVQVTLLAVAATLHAAPQQTGPMAPRFVLTTLNGTAIFDTLDGPVATAQVSANVSALAIGPADALYLADGSSIRRVASGVVTTLAGSAGETGSADGAGATARFSANIGGIAVMSDGTVIVADTAHHTIRRVAPDGTVSTWAGVPGVPGVAYGRGAAARFTLPVGVAVDGAGMVYVVDRACTLRRITPAGDVQPVAGLGTQCIHRDGNGSGARFSAPIGIAASAAGVVYVAEDNFTVRRVTTGGEVITMRRSVGDHGLRAISLTSSGTVRLLLGSYWDGSTPSPSGESGENAIRELSPEGILSLVVPLNTPRALGARGLATDSAGQSYVRNLDARDDITRVAVDGRMSTLIGVADRSPFGYLSDLAIAGDGTLAAVESVRTIRQIAADGTAGPVLTLTHGLDSLAAVGTDVYFSRGFNNANVLYRISQGAVTEFATLIPGALTALAPAPDGSFVAVISGQVWRISASGSASVLAIPGVASEGIAAAANGDIYYSDPQNHVIQRLTSDGAISTFAGSPGQPGHADGVGSAARFAIPTRLSFGPDGSLFVVDGRWSSQSNYGRGVSLRRISPTGEVVTLFTKRDDFFEGIAAAADGSVYVANGEALRRAVPAAPAPLVISTQPQSATASSGSSVTFTVEATGGPSPVIQWEQSADTGGTWTALEDPPASGASSGVLTIRNVATGMHGRRYRAVVSDADETLTSDVATLAVTGMTVSPASLRLGATKDGVSGSLYYTTTAQEVVVTFSDGAPAWTATVSAPWISLHLGQHSGTGSGRLRVKVENPDNIIGASTSLTGAITITTDEPSPSSMTIPVTLTVTQSKFGSGQQPIGQVDSPVQNAAGVQGALAVSGWAVDDIGVAQVALYRNCLGFENQASCQTVLDQQMVFLGNATFVAGARSDVEERFSTFPQNHRAGWGILLLTLRLPHVPAGLTHGGQGPLTLYAVATDVEGNRRLLGRSWSPLGEGFTAPTAITLDNDSIAKPFGTIDSPEPGGMVGGTLHNFGWVLTPDPGTAVVMPTDGSTITVYIDGAPVGTVAYNLCRGSVAVGGMAPPGVLCNDDVSTVFRGDGTRYRNLDAGRGAIGLRSIDTTTLADGVHTISWGVTDSANRSEGIGSRYFSVLNSGGSPDASSRADVDAVRRQDIRTAPSPIYARTGFDLQSAFTPLVANAEGVPQVRIPELGRVELQIPDVASGALLVSGEARALPVGVGVDARRGVVTWTPGVGHLGTYRLSFVPRAASTDVVQVDVTVLPASTAAEPVRMHVEIGGSAECAVGSRPAVASAGAPPGCALTVSGWALDPHAWTGSGIGAVHVWARRAGSDTSVFLGTADLNIARPDVAAAHGTLFSDAGFRLLTTLPEGQWDVTAFVWLARTGRFEDARSVAIAIR